MKKLSFYNDILGCKNSNEVFDFIITNLKPSNMLWSYFVNWDKVLRNTKQIELALNNLNYLIGKDNFDKEFKFLLKENPNLVKAIPALVVRDGSNKKKFKILVDYKNKKLVYEDYDFSKDKLTDEDIEKYLTFVKESGLKDLIVNKKIKNLVDYMIGVEAGLDSNGRKNRGGHAMEDIVEAFIIDLCNKKKLKYLKEANAEKLNENLITMFQLISLPEDMILL
ncbi:type II restriction endonuclease [Patescibacteria group bacterium]|nr:type II restriction endonuclease [Patescibacteria group bacterium]